MLSYQSKVVQLNRVAFSASKCMIFQIPSLLAWKSFHVKICIRAKILFSRVQNFRLHSATIFPPLLLRDSIGAGRKGNFAQKMCTNCRQSPKMQISSFWGGDNLLGHLDRGTSLGEPLKPLESVVDENPVLVRLAGVIIWGSGWKWKSESNIQVKVKFQWKWKWKCLQGWPVSRYLREQLERKKQNWNWKSGSGSEEISVEKTNG